jgi:hypothetical protein
LFVPATPVRIKPESEHIVDDRGSEDDPRFTALRPSRSLNTRAVMPTLVAVNVAPMNNRAKGLRRAAATWRRSSDASDPMCERGHQKGRGPALIIGDRRLRPI